MGACLLIQFSRIAYNAAEFPGPSLTGLANTPGTRRLFVARYPMPNSALFFPSESFRDEINYTIKNESECYASCMQQLSGLFKMSLLPESPVERLVFWHLATLDLSWVESDADGTSFLEVYPDYGELSGKLKYTYPMFVYPQFNITINGKKYRVDFMCRLAATKVHDLQNGNWKYIAVEIDGHDFHERTKEQAMRDKQRDRAFASEGITVLRFTGSEVWKDPSCVYRSVSEIMTKISVEKFGLV